MAICGILGGVAKAKAESIPIMQITALRFSGTPADAIIELATAETSVAVTIFDETFVCSIAHKPNMTRSNIAGMPASEPDKLD